MKIFVFKLLLLSILVVSQFAQASGGYSFLKVQVSSSHQDETALFWGQVSEEGVRIMSQPTESSIVPYMDAQLIKEAQEKLKRGLGRQQKANQLIHGNLSPSPVMQFQFNVRQIQRCTNSREFSGFLQQLPLFTTLIQEFIIYLDQSPTSRRCVEKIASALQTQKIKFSVSDQKLREAGILLRAQLVLNGESSSSNTEDDSAEMPFRGREMVLRLKDGTEDLIYVRDNRSFLKSYSPRDLDKKFPATLSYRGPEGQLAEVEIRKLSHVRLKEQPVLFADETIGQFIASSVDSLEKVYVPKIVSSRIADSQKVRNLTLGAHLAPFDFQANAFTKNEESVIPGFLARIDINSAFSLNGIGYLPVSAGPGKIKMTYLDLRFGYHPLRNFQNQSPWDFRFDFGLSTYQVDATRAEGQTGQQFLSLMANAETGAMATYQSGKHFLELGYLLSPMTSTGSSFTLSHRYRARYGYDFTQKHGVYLNFQKDDFRLDAPNGGEYFFTFSTIGIGLHLHLF